MQNPKFDRLTRLRSYSVLTPSVQIAVKLHLLKGIEPFEAMELAGVQNQQRTWESAKVRQVLADMTPTVDDLIADLESQPTSPVQPASPAPELRNPPPTGDAKAPSCPPAPKPTPEPTPPCATCGKPSSGNHNGKAVCPACMIVASGLKIDGSPIPPDEKPLPPQPCTTPRCTVRASTRLGGLNYCSRCFPPAYALHNEDSVECDFEMALSPAELKAYESYHNRLGRAQQFANAIAALPPEMDPASPKYQDPVDRDVRERADIVVELERNRRAKAEREADQATFDRYEAENLARSY